MRKRFTRRYRQGPPVRYKWTAKAEAALRGWEHDVRYGEIEDSIEDALALEAERRDEDPPEPTS